METLIKLVEKHHKLLKHITRGRLLILAITILTII